MNLTSNGRYGRRTILAFLLYGTAGAALANAPLQSLRPLRKPGDAVKRAEPEGAQIIESAKLGGHTSYVVADARTGEVLESVAPLRLHPPASVAKAVTAFYALERLGKDFRYLTQLVGTGPIVDNVLQGDLILIGSGDPLLTSDELYELASSLKTAGLVGVKGKLKVFEGALPSVEEIDPAQPLQVGYNPGIGGVNLNFNRAYLEWKQVGSSYTITMEARTERFRPAISSVGAKIVDGPGPIFTYSNDQDKERWTVARKALGKVGGRWLPVRRPGVYAGDVFRTLARSHGIELPKAELTRSVPDKVTKFSEHLSLPLHEICQGMLKFSTNLTAEVVGLTASGAGTLRASGRTMSEWAQARTGTRNAVFVDHSGLGDKTTTSAQDMVRALTAKGARDTLLPILKELAVRDPSGAPIENGPVKVMAKTGTLNFVSGLAGYIDMDDGQQLVFAIFASDEARREKLTREQRERPRGARSWNGRAKTMQQKLIRRWSVVHAADGDGT